MENKKITQEDINRTVWKACDTFRGVIDPSQYKDYILTMLSRGQGAASQARQATGESGPSISSRISPTV